MSEDDDELVELVGDERFAVFRAWHLGLRRYQHTVEYLRGMPSDIPPYGYMQGVAAALLRVTDLCTFPPEDVTDILDTALGRAHFVATPIEEHRWSLLRKCTVATSVKASGTWLANVWLGTRPRFNGVVDIAELRVMTYVRVAAKSPLREKRLPEITAWALRELYRADYEYLVALAAHAG
jgi:hypothetical protein